MAQNPRIYQNRIDFNLQIVDIPKVPDRFAHREGFVLFNLILKAITHLMVYFRVIKRAKKELKAL